MKHSHVRSVARLAALSLALAGAGCSFLDPLKDSKVDYRNGARKTAQLDVPPDLTPLARDGRYAPQGAPVSALGLQQQRAGRAAAPVSAGANVALQQAGEWRIERQGQQRWLTTNRAPEVVWPQVRQFWLDQGFSLLADNAKAGILETDWQENRAKLPKDVIRQALGKVLDRLFDTSERDRYRIRLERTAAGGTEIFVAHHGLALEVDRANSVDPVWVARANDPTMEAEMLSLLMLQLSGSAESATHVAAGGADRGAPASSPAVKRQAMLWADLSAGAGLNVDEPLERAWRRVGLALDRGGFAVEERDQTQGIYYVRYVDPKLAGQESNFFTRLFSSDKSDKALARYRVALKADGDRTRVSILDNQGNAERSENGKRIATVLVEELK